MNLNAMEELESLNLDALTRLQNLKMFLSQCSVCYLRDHYFHV